jgi:hypothetical protein
VQPQKVGNERITLYNIKKYTAKRWERWERKVGNEFRVKVGNLYNLPDHCPHPSDRPKDFSIIGKL